MRNHEGYKVSITTQRQCCRTTDTKTKHRQLLQTVTHTCIQDC